MILKAENLSFSYGSKPVLKDISFELSSGEIVGVFGINGAGKTTLLKLIADLLVRDTGSLTLDGTDPLADGIKYRRTLGYLSERSPLYDDMTVESYLVYRTKLKGERSSRWRHRVADVESACGLEELLHERIASLSMGFRKRVGMADALLRRPRLLVLDDPLSGVDFSTARRMGEILTDASSRSGILVSGHNTDEMLRWCTRYLFLDQGEILYSEKILPGEYDRQLRELKDRLVEASGRVPVVSE